MGADERRVKELLRVNAELAAEVRSLVAGRTEVPRSAGAPVSRRLARLLTKRDELAAQLDAARAELDIVKNERDELTRRLDALQREVTRLRSGLGGLLLRARARLLRS